MGLLLEVGSAMLVRRRWESHPGTAGVAEVEGHRSERTAPMESLVKQVNLRVKGTEMFWNDAEKGGESILQIRAAVLSEDGRLDTFLENRPGSPFVRRVNANAYKTLKS